jgi:hypothetical protein
MNNCNLKTNMTEQVQEGKTVLFCCEMSAKCRHLTGHNKYYYC